MSHSSDIIMSHRELLDNLMKTHRLTPQQAEKSLPDRPGVYAIFVDKAESLSQPFAEMQKGRETDPIYIGKASGSIKKRCHDQDLRHKSAATFFRTIGAVLGYTPPRGSLIGARNKNNYKFSKADTFKIILWLDKHVTVSAIEISPEEIKTVEPAMIRTVMPLLNIQCNPQALPQLSDLRAKCRAIAVQEV